MAPGELTPVFAVEPTPGNSAGSHNATVTYGKGVKLICSTSAASENAEQTELRWVHEGDYMQNDDTYEISSDSQSTTLHIPSTSMKHQGVYECLVRTKSKKVIATAQVRVTLRTADWALGTNVELCAAEEADYCLNGGICLKDKATNVQGCGCQPGFEGKRCQSAYSHVDMMQQEIISCPDIRGAIFNNSLMIGGIFGVSLFIMCMICLLLFRRNKTLENEKRARMPSQTDSLGSGFTWSHYYRQSSLRDSIRSSFRERVVSFKDGYEQLRKPRKMSAESGASSEPNLLIPTKPGLADEPLSPSTTQSIYGLPRYGAYDPETALCQHSACLNTGGHFPVELPLRVRTESEFTHSTATSNPCSN